MCLRIGKSPALSPSPPLRVRDCRQGARSPPTTQHLPWPLGCCAGNMQVTVLMDVCLLLSWKRAVGEQNPPISLEQAHLTMEKSLKLRAKIFFRKNWHPQNKCWASCCSLEWDSSHTLTATMLCTAGGSSSTNISSAAYTVTYQLNTGPTIWKINFLQAI